MRSGGLALSLPIVLGLGATLLLVNSLVAVIVLGGLLTGDSVVAPYIGWLMLSLTVGVGAMVMLFRAVFRYTGGIGKLWQRRQHIQEERKRVERLIDSQNADPAQDIDLLYDDETRTNQQEQ